jgi:GNAT superfamily N-acetyltransferase
MRPGTDRRPTTFDGAARDGSYPAGMAPRNDLRIEPLTADRFDDLAALFREGGDPRWCFCMFWRLRSKDFSAATVAQNRARLRDLTAGPLAPGLVAYRGDRAVGWCSLGPREDFERLERSRIIPRVDDQAVWSIICFAVSSSARGEGVAAQLLDAAAAWAGRQGAKILEAYPVDTEAGTPINPDAAYMGTLPMFERAGFRVVSPTGSKAAGRPRVVVRKALG